MNCNNCGDQYLSTLIDKQMTKHKYKYLPPQKLQKLMYNSHYQIIDNKVLCGKCQDKWRETWEPCHCGCCNLD